MIHIVGGGVAGISAALCLAEAGEAAILYESRGELGGRARSYRDPASGREIDTGQHIVVPVTTEILSLYERLGARMAVRWHRRIPFRLDDGSFTEMGFSPFDFLSFSGLTFGEKLQFVRGLLRARHTPAAGLNGAEYLDAIGLRGRARWLIEFFIVPTLNVRPEQADGESVRFLIREGLAKRGGFDIGVPTMPLSRLYANLDARLRESGGAVIAGERVTKLIIEGEQITGFQTPRGQVRSDHVILAVASKDVAPLLPADWREREPFASIARIPSSPICGVVFFYDRDLPPRPPLVACPGRTTDMFFTNGRAVTGVYSAAFEVAKLSRNEILARAREDLAWALPELAGIEPSSVAVTKEMHATFIPAPGLARPAPVTPVRGLFLAGDYIDTGGWPSTMESAARSGRLAASCLLPSA